MDSTCRLKFLPSILLGSLNLNCRTHKLFGFQCDLLLVQHGLAKIVCKPALKVSGYRTTLT